MDTDNWLDRSELKATCPLGALRLAVSLTFPLGRHERSAAVQGMGKDQ